MPNAQLELSKIGICPLYRILVGSKQCLECLFLLANKEKTIVCSSNAVKAIVEFKKMYNEENQ